MWVCHVQLTPSWAQSTSTPNRMYFSPYTGGIICSKAKALRAGCVRSDLPGHMYLQVRLSQMQQFAGRGAHGPAGAANTHSQLLCADGICGSGQQGGQSRGQLPGVQRGGRTT